MNGWARFKQSWRATSNWNKLLVCLTATIAVANGFYVHYARKQFETMHGQLQQMESAGSQTDRLIFLYRQQLAELHNQAADTHTLADDAGKQAGAARKAAVAAESASVTTREALTSVQRAFVSFVGVASAAKIISGNKTTDLLITLPWENAGVTPTKNATSRVNWQSFAGDLPENFNFPDIGQIQTSQFELPPRGYGNGTLTIPIGYMDSARTGGLRLFVWGWITYNDIFDRTPTRLSEFCDEITDVKSSTEDITETSSNISWKLSLCKLPHNCSDERCADYKERTRTKH